MTNQREIPGLDLEALEAAVGGMRYDDNDRESDNVEDRRPQSQGGPVPDDEWQKEQEELDKEKEDEDTDGDPEGEENPGPDDGNMQGGVDGGEGDEGSDGGGDGGDGGD